MDLGATALEIVQLLKVRGNEGGREGGREGRVALSKERPAFALAEALDVYWEGGDGSRGCTEVCTLGEGKSVPSLPPSVSPFLL